MNKIFLFLVMLSLVFSLTACETAEEEGLDLPPAPDEGEVEGAPVGQVYVAGMVAGEGEDITYPCEMGADGNLDLDNCYFELDPNILDYKVEPGQTGELVLRLQKDTYFYNGYKYFDSTLQETEMRSFSDLDGFTGEVKTQTGSRGWIPVGDTALEIPIKLEDEEGMLAFFVLGCKKRPSAEFSSEDWNPARDCHGDIATAGAGRESYGMWLTHLINVQIVSDHDNDQASCEGAGFDWIGTACCGDDNLESAVSGNGLENCCKHASDELDETGACMDLPPSPEEVVAVVPGPDEIVVEMNCEEPLVEINGMCCMDEEEPFGECDGVVGSGSDECYEPAVMIGDICCMDEEEPFGECDPITE